MGGKSSKLFNMSKNISHFCILEGWFFGGIELAALTKSGVKSLTVLVGNCITHASAPLRSGRTRVDGGAMKGYENTKP